MKGIMKYSRTIMLPIIHDVYQGREDQHYFLPQG